MQTTKILVAAACSFLLSTSAFAQTTPSPAGTNTPAAMSSSVDMQPQRGTGIRKDGSVEPNADMQNGGTGGKSKMRSHKGGKKTKTSTTSSNSGTR